MNVCLFAFRFKLSAKEERIIRVLGDFHRLFKIRIISSVYKKTSDEATTKLDEEMSFAIRTETALNVENLLDAKTALQGSDFKVEFLVFNNEIQWTPELPLPSPLLHFDPLVLHCCAEIAPAYIHPILKEDLKTLDINNIRTDFEFLFQGKIYIDQLR
jgi:7,8-dihydro-6-hydroxymethylpterin-pyrophosphokinase